MQDFGRVETGARDVERADLVDVRQEFAVFRVRQDEVEPVHVLERAVELGEERRSHLVVRVKNVQRLFLAFNVLVFLLADYVPLVADFDWKERDESVSFRQESVDAISHNLTLQRCLIWKVLGLQFVFLLIISLIETHGWGQVI